MHPGKPGELLFLQGLRMNMKKKVELFWKTMDEYFFCVNAP